MWALMKKTIRIAIAVSLICMPMKAIGEALTFPQSEAEFVDALSIKKTAEPNIKIRGLTHSYFPPAGGVITALQPPPKVGARVTFDHDSFTIKPESCAVLDNFGNALNGGLSDAVIIVAGHTDSAGADTYNLSLSIHRAQAVVNYLVYRHHIDINRLIVKGYGEAFPISGNDTEEGKAANRRVEFIRVTHTETKP